VSNCSHPEAVATNNVHHVIDEIAERSPILGSRYFYFKVMLVQFVFFSTFAIYITNKTIWLILPRLPTKLTPNRSSLPEVFGI
jgi:hypothetical protein